MWFYASLLTALISGIYTVLSKHTLKNIDPTVFYWAVMTTSLPFIWIAAIKEGIPTIRWIFFLGVFGSVTLYTFSKIIYYRVIKDAELSHTQPLVALGPIFSLIFSYLILSEKLSLAAAIGSFITLVGAYILNVSSMREGLFEPFKIFFKNKLARLMLVSVIVGSIVVVFDKIAINNTFPQRANFALAIEDTIIVFAFLPWLFLNRQPVFNEIKSNIKPIFVLGILGAASNMLSFFAISKSNPGLYSSVARTQILFTLLLSFIFFKDRPKAETIVGSIIMILGLLILKLFSF